MTDITTLYPKQGVMTENFTLQDGDIAVVANTIYLNCVPATESRTYTLPGTAKKSDKVGFRISGVDDTIFVNVVGTIDGAADVDIKDSGDYFFTYNGSEWTAAIVGIRYS
jgi:hypothetical protein